MQTLIGRTRQLERFNALVNSNRSEFLAVYGRRRVGKTFLIREAFNNDFHFQHTGLANINMELQLGQFHASLLEKTNDLGMIVEPPKDWFTAFRNLSQYLTRLKKNKKKVIFIDELPWMDTQNSKFISALEHFWNGWASARDDIFLIVCGSAASWMINKLINNKGGLHNRVTERMKLEPFTLAETEIYFKSKLIQLDRYQQLILYMVFGGIPFYLDKIVAGKSAMQNINELCFSEYAPFRSEYELIYASLFKSHERHMQIVETLAKKPSGMSRKDIANQTTLSNGGGLTRLLNELEESGFIRKYKVFGQRQNLYQLVDFYTLFFHRFIKNANPTNNQYWMNLIDSSKFYTWAGLAFEKACLCHTPQIKKALGISGVQSTTTTWQSKEAQIDLIIDRKDHVINLCEMKFSIHPFSIDKSYAKNLTNKLVSFKKTTKSKKSLFLTMVTTHGIDEEKHLGLVQNSIDMHALFES